MGPKYSTFGAWMSLQSHIPLNYEVSRIVRFAYACINCNQSPVPHRPGVLVYADLH